MEKYLKRWFFAIFAVFMAVSFTACGDDDDEPEGKTPQKLIVGKWVCDKDAYGDYWDEPLIFQFDTDGGGYMWFTEEPFSSRDEFNYTITDTKINLKFIGYYGERYSLRYELSEDGKRLVMYGYDDNDMEELHFIKQGT